MNHKRKKYKELSLRTLLVIAYFFLTILQCNSRFYTIANFYVLSSHSPAQDEKAKDNKHISSTHITFAQNLHLKLNKRFKDEPHAEGILKNACQAPAVDEVYIESKTKFLAFARIYSGAYFLAPCLRGPPCA